MHGKIIESTITTHACAIAGRTVHIRRTRSVAADGSTCSQARCAYQDSCIVAARVGASCGS